MSFRPFVRLAVVGFVGLAAAGAARAPVLPPVQPGAWTVSFEPSASRAPRTLCIGDVTGFGQLEHRGAGCARFTVEADRRGATVHYTCGGSGFGRTIVRVLTPRSVSIETQGVEGERPYSYRADARRSGACEGQGAGRR